MKYNFIKIAVIAFIIVITPISTTFACYPLCGVESFYDANPINSDFNNYNNFNSNTSFSRSTNNSCYPFCGIDNFYSSNPVNSDFNTYSQSNSNTSFSRNSKSSCYPFCGINNFYSSNPVNSDFNSYNSNYSSKGIYSQKAKNHNLGGCYPLCSLQSYDGY